MFRPKSFLTGKLNEVSLVCLLTSVLRMDIWDGSVSILIRYLVKAQIPLNEVEKLKLSEVFTENAPAGKDSERPRYRADELYPPEAIFHQLQLPIISWDEDWFNESPEGRNVDLFYWIMADNLLFSPTDVSPRFASFPIPGENHRALFFIGCVGQDSCFSILLQEPWVTLSGLQARGLPRCRVHPCGKQFGTRHSFENAK